MRTVQLDDGTTVFCLRAPEAVVLDGHVNGYLGNGIDIHDGDIVFDVGANIGLLGVRICQRFPNTKVYAFEPIPEIFRVAQANADKFGKGNFTVIPLGVSDEDGELTFTYFPHAPALSTSNTGQCDIDPAQFEEAVKGNLAHMPNRYRWLRLVPGFLIPLIARQLRRGPVAVSCKLTTVSKVVEERGIPKIDLLKVDCEGAELSVLQGIKQDHWPLIGKVVAEVHDVEGRLDAVSSLLRSQGVKNIRTEKEKGFEKTQLINIFAVR